jgi:hypothetical protein
VSFCPQSVKLAAMQWHFYVVIGPYLRMLLQPNAQHTFATDVLSKILYLLTKCEQKHFEPLAADSIQNGVYVRATMYKSGLRHNS